MAPRSRQRSFTANLAMGTCDAPEGRLSDAQHSVPKRSCSHLIYLVRERARKLQFDLAELSEKKLNQASHVAWPRSVYASLEALWNDLLPLDSSIAARLPGGFFLAWESNGF